MYAGLYLTSASSNTITNNYISNPASTAAYITGNSQFNVISSARSSRARRPPRSTWTLLNTITLTP